MTNGTWDPGCGVRFGDAGGRISVEKGEIDTNHTVRWRGTGRYPASFLVFTISVVT